MDETLYGDENRVEELTELVQEQADAKAKIENLEWEWLDASEDLEKAK